MKKIYLSLTLIFATILSTFFIHSTTYASCPATFYIGSEITSECSDNKDNQEAGYSIDTDNNKITLNNYNGGGIHFACHASCSPVREMTIELIGNNTINSKLPSSFSTEYGGPSNINDIGFYNILPTFTGTGTLNIIAPIPFANEESKSITLKTMSDSSDPTPTISLSTPNDAINYSDNNEMSTVQTEEKTEIEETEDEEIEVITEDDSVDEESPDNEFFLNTPAGIILLVSIPILLIVALILLIILLVREKKH